MREGRRLALVVLAAAAVRIWGIGFGLPHVGARPDEPQIAGPAVGFLSGNLRPPYLEWPTLFAYTVALMYALYFLATRPFGGYPTLAAFAESRRIDISPFLCISRGLSALMGVLAVWWTYGIGRRAFDSTVGLVAASFLAVAFLHVRDSHFGVTDVTMTALVMLAVLAILNWRQSGGARRAVLAGLAAGLATSAKYNAVLVCVTFAVAAAQRLHEERADGTRAIGRNVLALVLFACAFPLALFATSPYVLIDWPRVVRALTATQSMFLSGHSIVLGRGWWYYASVVLPAAVGWPMFLAGVAGTFLLLVTRFRQAAVVVAFPITYYIVAGRGLGVFARYILPVVPFLCLAAAWLTVQGVRWATRNVSPARRRGAMVTATLLMLAPTAYKSVLLDRLLARPDNREITGRALNEILPPGSLIYQTGESYGHVPLDIGRRRTDLRSVRFDSISGRFRPDEPDWILVQRSPLVVYSGVHPSVERLLHERYVLARRFPTVSDPTVKRIYDQQDAFYVPLSGLEGIRRAGPEFELYVRRRP
ncbi:MAG: glycosyltransferase family 39 protein [Acidobacteria bacterium]|nr:glycosyltransferase family 39 protein [Acidobacteriota bacterium]